VAWKVANRLPSLSNDILLCKHKLPYEPLVALHRLSNAYSTFSQGWDPITICQSAVPPRCPEVNTSEVKVVGICKPLGTFALERIHAGRVE